MFKENTLHREIFKLQTELKYLEQRNKELMAVEIQRSINTMNARINQRNEETNEVFLENEKLTEELEKVRAESKVEYDYHRGVIERHYRNEIKYRDELTAWKEQAERLEIALEFYKDIHDKKVLVFDNPSDSRAAVYEKYKKQSIGEFGVKAIEALTQFNEFKKLQSGNKEPESAQETGESDRTVKKESEG